MEICILNYDYHKFIEWLYHDYYPGLAEESYEKQQEIRHETLFSGISLGNKFQELGHDVHLVHHNNEYIQKRWAAEHGIDVQPPSHVAALSRLNDLSTRNLRKAYGWLDFRLAEPYWYYKILEAQIRELNPDVILNRGLAIDATLFEKVSDHFEVLVGEVSLPGQLDASFDPYDLIITPFEKFDRELQSADVRSAHIRFGFDDDLYQQTSERDDSPSVSFVGSLTSTHSERIELLEHLCRNVSIEVWAPDIETLSADSPIRQAYRGPAWGKEMYDIIGNSGLTINRHIDTADGIVGNHRTYEVTGLETVLVTDQKPGLENLFEPGRDLVTYSSPDECLERIEYYLDHDDERQAIASYGRERARKDHLYIDRARQYETVFQDVL